MTKDRRADSTFWKTFIELLQLLLHVFADVDRGSQATLNSRISTSPAGYPALSSASVPEELYQRVSEGNRRYDYNVIDKIGRAHV